MAKFRVPLVLLLSIWAFDLGLSLAKKRCFTPVKKNYNLIGRMRFIGGEDVYETKDKTPKFLLFGVYDWFGFKGNNNTRQVADKVARGGFRVVMPDFFNGKPGDGPGNAANRPPWAKVKPVLESLMKTYRAEGVTNFGVFGWCWGGRVAFDAAMDLDGIVAAGSVHPGGYNLTEAGNVKVPLFLFPSKQEHEVVGKVYEAIKGKFPQSFLHKFEALNHGFAGNGGDFDAPNIKEAVDIVISNLQQKFRTAFSGGVESVKKNYVPEGTMWQNGDMAIYETKDKTPKFLLFAVYDWFGFLGNTNTRQVADMVAKGGFRVVMPDFFKGKPGDGKDNAGNRPAWPQMKSVLEALMTKYKGEGVKDFGIFGWCLGGRTAFDAAMDLDGILAAGMIHPAGLNSTEADKVKVPLFLFPSKQEHEEVGKVYEKIKERLSTSVLQKFELLNHGFAGNNGNFDDANIQENVGMVIQLLINNFKRVKTN